MKTIIYLGLLFFLSCSKDTIYQRSEDGSELLYYLNSTDLKYNCEYYKEEQTCLCSIGSHSEKTEWLFRRTKDIKWCEDFERSLKKVLAANERISLLGYDVPNDNPNPSELQYFGALKSSHGCFEWFLGDCKKLP